MKKMSSRLENATSCLGEENLFISECYYTGPVPNPPNNDIFNADLKQIFQYTMNDIIEDGIVHFIHGETRELSYYDEIERFDGNKMRPSLNFTKFNINDAERIFLFFNIHCMEDKEVVFKLGRSKNFKLWVNGQLLYNNTCEMIEGFYQPVGFSDTLFMQTLLCKGDNIITIELNRSSLMISVRVDLLKNESLTIDDKLLMDYYQKTCLNRMSIIHECCNQTDSECYKFVVMPRDHINLRDQEVLIHVRQTNGKVVSSFYSKFYKVNELYLSELRTVFAEKEIMNIDFFYCCKYGMNHQSNIKICLSSIEKFVDTVQQKLNHFKRNHMIDEEGELNIAGRLNEMLAEQHPLLVEKMPWIIENEKVAIEQLFQAIEEGKPVRNALILSRTWEYYYRTKLDGSIQKIAVCLPCNYKKDIKYPIIINIRGEVDSDFLKFHHSLQREDVIFAVVSQRKLTQGSYMGEAAILESLDILKNIFNIEDQSIHLVGYSTGAFAVWSMIQNHPDVFASAAPISGYPYMKNIGNCQNVNILNISSVNDDMFERAYNEPTLKLKSISEHYESEVISGDHLTLVTAQYSNYIFDWLTEHKRISDPDTVYLRTERIRHNKSYWVTINSIPKDKQFAEIKAIKNVMMEKTVGIDVTLDDVDSFRMMIPETEKGICVRISASNMHEFSSVIASGGVYNFSKANHSWDIKQNADHVKLNKSSMGMGLLDIYMDKLSFVVPEAEKNRDGLLNIVKRLTNPLTLAFDKELEFEYPCYVNMKLEELPLINSNIIILGSGFGSKIQDLNDRMPIKLYDEYFEYKGERHFGLYCILYIHDHPFAEGEKMVVVYANDAALLRKNFFLRNFIIPSYSNGRHKYLNNEALLLKENKYYCIDVLGNDIQLI